jgi:hypothetical protein
MLHRYAGAASPLREGGICYAASETGNGLASNGGGDDQFMAIMPAVVFYGFADRQIVGGLTAGSVKG